MVSCQGAVDYAAQSPPKAKAEAAREGEGSSKEKAGEGPSLDTEIEGHASTSAGGSRSKKTMSGNSLPSTLMSPHEMRQPAFSDAGPPEPPGMTEAELQLAKLEAVLMKQKALVQQQKQANAAESQATTLVDWTRQEEAARRRAGPVDESEDSDSDGGSVDSPPSKLFTLLDGGLVIVLTVIVIITVSSRAVILVVGEVKSKHYIWDILTSDPASRVEDLGKRPPRKGRYEFSLDELKEVRALPVQEALPKATYDDPAINGDEKYW
eukprot:jgi/Mesvir1/16276/Mv08520-RA.1